MKVYPLHGVLANTLVRRCRTCQRSLALQEELAAARARIADLERRVEMLMCGELGAFYDGALEAAREAAFREHLVRCTACHRDLAGYQRIKALFSAARAPKDSEP